MRGLTILLMFVAVLTGSWAFMWTFPLGNRILIISNESGYVRATFTVEHVRYTQDPDNALSWWAEGRVDGAGVTALDERFGLSARFPDPGGQRELERLVPEGTTFDVYFNDAMTSVILQGETLRVLEYSPTLWDDERDFRDAILLKGIGPFALSVVLLVGVKVVALVTRPPKDRYGSFHADTAHHSGSPRA